LKYEGEDFVASCAALMEQFSIPAGDLVQRLESKMFQLQRGMVNPLSAVSGPHIEAVRQELVKLVEKRKQEEKYRAMKEERYKKKNARLQRERKSFEENCRLCTYPSIKSAAWEGVPFIDSAEEPASDAERKSTVFSSSYATIVVQVERKLSSSSARALVLFKVLCIT
jgi:hypothetical protein